MRPLRAEDFELDPDERGFLASMTIAALAPLSCSDFRRIQHHRSIRSSIGSRFVFFVMGATMSPDHGAGNAHNWRVRRESHPILEAELKSKK